MSVNRFVAHLLDFKNSITCPNPFLRGAAPNSLGGVNSCQAHLADEGLIDL